jgi:hypothetical protein
MKDGLDQKKVFKFHQILTKKTHFFSGLRSFSATSKFPERIFLFDCYQS